MKFPVIVTVGIFIFFAACKKGGNEPAIPHNSWQHETVIQQAKNSSRFRSGSYSAINFTASSLSEGTDITFSFFNNLPRTGGIYKVTAGPQADDEMGVISSEDHGPGHNSLSMGALCQVLVDENGKISVWATHVAMKEMLFVGGDTSYYSFNLTEF